MTSTAPDLLTNPYWRAQFGVLAGAYGEELLEAYTAGKPVERLVLLARWAASYGLDALQIREDSERDGICGGDGDTQVICG